MPQTLDGVSVAQRDRQAAGDRTTRRRARAGNRRMGGTRKSPPVEHLESRPKPPAPGTQSRKRPLNAVTSERTRVARLLLHPFESKPQTALQSRAGAKMFDPGIEPLGWPGRDSSGGSCKGPGAGVHRLVAAFRTPRVVRRFVGQRLQYVPVLHDPAVVVDPEDVYARVGDINPASAGDDSAPHHHPRQSPARRPRSCRDAPAPSARNTQRRPPCRRPRAGCAECR